MPIGLYDDAVTQKIKNWVMDPNLTILYPDETNRLFTQTIDKKNDKVLQLPLIAISRDRDIDVGITAKRPLTHRGKTFNADTNSADHLNSVPITLRYQIDIYTRYRAEADEYVRNFVFQIINHPKLTIELPYLECNIKQDSFMTLEPSIADNSDIPERLIPGEFTRMTLRFSLADAQLYSYTIKQIPKINDIGIYLDESMSKQSHASGDACEQDAQINLNN